MRDDHAKKLCCACHTLSISVDAYTHLMVSTHGRLGLQDFWHSISKELVFLNMVTQALTKEEKKGGRSVKHIILDSKLSQAVHVTKSRSGQT